MHKKIFPWLDLFRFLAALSVLLTHVRGFLFLDYASLSSQSQNLWVKVFFACTRLGTESVIVFFVLSGFLVGGKSIIRLKEGTFKPKEYLLDRFVRVFVPLIPALFLTISVLFFTNSEIKYLDVMGNVLSFQGIFVSPLSGNAPLWSLSYEVWFYLLVYFLSLFILKKRKVSYFLLFIIALSIFTKLNYIYLFCWLIGALVFTFSLKSWNTKLFIFSLATMLLGVVTLQLTSNSIYFSNNLFISILSLKNLAPIVLSLGFSLLISNVINIEPKNFFFKGLNKLGILMAPFSYTLYLTHYPLLTIFKKVNFLKYDTVNLMSFTLYIFVSFGCLFVAWLIYLPFEKRNSYYKSKIKTFLN